MRALAILLADIPPQPGGGTGDEKKLFLFVALGVVALLAGGWMLRRKKS